MLHKSICLVSETYFFVRFTNQTNGATNKHMQENKSFFSERCPIMVVIDVLVIQYVTTV